MASRKKGCVGQCAAYGEQAWTQPETNLSIGALASFPDFSGRMILPAISSHYIFFCGIFSNNAPPYPTPSPLCILWLFFSLCSPVFFFLSLPSGCQTFLSVTWWRWCWRLLCPRSPKGSATCCCARLGSYWVCLTATSWFKKSVHFTSRGESHTSYNILILCFFTFFLCIFLEVRQWLPRLICTRLGLANLTDFNFNTILVSHDHKNKIMKVKQLLCCVPWHIGKCYPEILLIHQHPLAGRTDEAPH